MVYWQLFYTFFRIGTFTIGGGFAMIPLIKDEVVNKHKWLSEKDFIDMLAITQSAPGVIAINTAIFLGYKMRGIKGAIVTSLGAIVPSFVIILTIAMIFTELSDNATIERIFKGIRPAVVALILAPMISLSKAANITWKTVWIPIGTAALIYIGVSPVLIIIAAMIAGILYMKRKEKNEN